MTVGWRIDSMAADVSLGSGRGRIDRGRRRPRTAGSGSPGAEGMREAAHGPLRRRRGSDPRATVDAPADRPATVRAAAHAAHLQPTTSSSTGPSRGPWPTWPPLRNDGPAPGEHYLAAGIPWFATLFGRDSIIAALETLRVHAGASRDHPRGSGPPAGHDRDDPGTDAEPGKILHELRTGEMARAGETPHAAYYGSVDSTPLWLILLGETHAWTGDDDLVERLWPHALAALDWIDHYGRPRRRRVRRIRASLASAGCSTRAGRTRATRSAHVDGILAAGPIALAEVQGYVYAARRCDGPSGAPPR